MLLKSADDRSLDLEVLEALRRRRGLDALQA
jgi:hypothetical protein